MKFISFFQNEEDIVYSILKAIYNDKVERWKKYVNFMVFFHEYSSLTFLGKMMEEGGTQCLLL